MEATPIWLKPISAEASPAIRGNGVNAVARAAGPDIPIAPATTIIGIRM